MEFRLNGVKKIHNGDLNISLLKYLREIEAVTSAKDGCSGQGACGACVVEVNRKAVRACLKAMKRLENSEVITIEGIGEYKQRVFANAFVEKGGVQCGFCTPGIVMQAKVLLDKNPNPTREDIEKALDHNLCRCTGYKKIIDSIIYAAKAIREGKEIPRPKSSGKIGSRQPKYGADKLVLGQRAYVADMKIEGMLHGALKFSDHPRAKVLAIDVSEAKKMAGVIRVFTVDDIPEDRHLGIIISDWPLMIKIGEDTRYVGDVLAAVVAESEEIARAAVKLIKVDYEVLKAVTDPHEALKAVSPKVHENGNLLSETIINRGEVKKALEEATFISQGVYQTQRIEHAYLEPECCLAQPLDDGIELFSQTQGVYEDQKQIAKLLDLSLKKVKVVLVPNGGGFGGKEDLTVQGHAALFAYLLQKPVRVALTRDESIRMSTKRHPLEMNYKLGCNKEGKLTVLEANIIGDSGAYASVGMKVLERAAGHATGAYHVPNAAIVSRAVYTNNLPGGAMRGFGVNQVTFALESCIDDLCKQGGFDRWQFRYDNALKDGDSCSTGQVIKGGCGARETLLAVKDYFKNSKYAGIACGIKNTGIGNGMPDEGKIKVTIESATKVIIDHGWTEMGQGVYTMAVQFLCQETAINPDFVEVRVETPSGATAGMTTASRATSIIGNAIINTSQQIKKDLKNNSLADLVGRVYESEWVCDWTTKPGAKVEEIITHYSYSYAAQVVVLDDDGFVDTVYAAHDAGKIINPTLFEGQVEGAVHMGLGYGLTEDLPMENGLPKHTHLRKLGILRAKETPNIIVIGVEVPDPHGPYGAKGVGEIGLVPTAAAVANALCKFDGVRRYRLPLEIKSRKS